MTFSAILRENLDRVNNEIHQACTRSGRDPAHVRLVAVTKYAAWQWIEALRLVMLDQSPRCRPVFGENRPQQLADRAVRMPDVEWHLIGQLQRNKARLVADKATLIHSVDSVRLLERLAEVRSVHSFLPGVLLQVNVTGELSKSGFSIDRLQDTWSEILSFSAHIRIVGLMTMAAESDDPESARPAFAALRNLRDSLMLRTDTASHHVNLTELSMGMSGDFIPAVEEGATLVRIGSRLFQGLEESRE